MSRFAATVAGRCGATFLTWLVFASVAWASEELSQATEPSPTLTHRMMVLVLQLGVILFMARLGGLVFERMRLPAVWMVTGQAILVIVMSLPWWMSRMAKLKK